MDILLLLLRLGLAGVMALAGFAKLADLEGSKKAFEGFGVTGRLAKLGPVVLSMLEIAIAVMLLFVQTSWYGAIGALILLVVFIAQMGYQLSKGNAPDCHCFGQVYSEPISAVSIIRNVIFAIPAVVLAARGQSGQGAGIADPSVNTLELVLGVVTIALLVAALAYLRKLVAGQRQILRQIEVMEIVARDGAAVERETAVSPHDGMPIGAMAPEFLARDMRGDTISLAKLSEGATPLLLLFVSPNCTPCKSLIPDFEQWIEDLAGKVRLVFLSSGTLEENWTKFGEKIASRMLLQDAREVAELYRARWTPSGILIDGRGRIASHVTAGDTAIRSLVEKIENEDLSKEAVHFTNGNSGTYSHAPLGQPVPDIAVADIRGREITSDFFKGKPTLVTFWSTTCPHCVSMLEELRNWDKAKGRDEPNLLVFSDGDRTASENLDLDSPVIYDPGHATGGRFGMFGTPSAVLINENGVFVSETAIGAADIWSLIGKRK